RWTPGSPPPAPATDEVERGARLTLGVPAEYEPTRGLAAAFATRAPTRTGGARRHRSRPGATAHRAWHRCVGCEEPSTPSALVVPFASIAAALTCTFAAGIRGAGRGGDRQRRVTGGFAARVPRHVATAPRAGAVARARCAGATRGRSLSD